MREYHLTVMSPAGEVFNDDVIALSLRGYEGDLAVFGGHIPFITTVKPGKCTITLKDESELEGELTSGILNVGKEDVNLMIGDKITFTKI